jgi:hypothetical protein
MRSFLLACFLGFASLSTQAQDTILRTNGDEVKAQVLTISPTDVAFVPSTEPPTTDTLHLAATEVFLIRYANGTKEILTSVAPMEVARTAQEMESQGRLDARQYFMTKGVFWGTAAATFITLPAYGVGGLATGLAIAGTPPKPQKMVVSDQALLSDPNYVSGYQKQAQRQKLGSAAGGFGVGLATGAVVVIGLILATFSTVH